MRDVVTEEEWKKCFVEEKQLSFEHPNLTAKIKPPKILCTFLFRWFIFFLFKVRNLILKF